MLKHNVLAVVVRSTFEEDRKYNPEVFSDDCLYEV